MPRKYTLWVTYDNLGRASVKGKTIGAVRKRFHLLVFSGIIFREGQLRCLAELNGSQNAVCLPFECNHRASRLPGYVPFWAVHCIFGCITIESFAFSCRAIQLGVNLLSVPLARYAENRCLAGKNGTSWII